MSGSAHSAGESGSPAASRDDFPQDLTRIGTRIPVGGVVAHAFSVSPMSYDLTIAAYRELGVESIEAWASEQSFELVAAADGKSHTVQRPGRGDVGYVCGV